MVFEEFEIWRKKYSQNCNPDNCMGLDCKTCAKQRKVAWRAALRRLKDEIECHPPMDVIKWIDKEIGES